MHGIKDKIAAILGSRRFYWAVIIFFVLEALWVALSANYPMAFDEDFHFGVIHIYGQQWSPFLTDQPDGANKFGALATDPSYLYHYLMSFPYRLMAAITSNQTAQVIFLRLINIAFLTAGILLFRKVLSRAGSSRLLINVATLIFVLIPTVPLLAGQINYDNLFVLALAGVCWLAVCITEDVRAGKANVLTMLWLVALVALTSLVKYAFLPMALAVCGYLMVLIGAKIRRQPREFLAQIKASYRGISKGVKIAMLATLLLSSAMFLQRYGINSVRYGHPVPDCQATIGLEACMEYGPWGRNYRFAAQKSEVNSSPLAYTWLWIQGMHYRLFFMITGPPAHTNYPPALLPSAAAVVIVVFGALSTLFYWRQVFAGRPILVFFVVMAVLYVGVLWSQNYSQYLETGQPVAINGRYLIPLLLPLAAVLGRSLSVALGAWSSARKWAAIAVVFFFLQGGGAFSFILRSDSSWYWPNQAIIKTNEVMQHTLAPVMFVGPKKY